MSETKKTTPTTKPTDIVEKKENAIQDVGQNLINTMMRQVESFADSDGTLLSTTDREFAVNTICDMDKMVRERGLIWKQIDVVGCKVPQQIKRYARLGLSTSESEIFIDIKFNKKTGKHDMFIKKQYQGIEKMLVRFYKGGGKIERIKKGIICVGDEISVEEDFETGIDKITKHIKNPKLSKEDRNSLDNIDGAYAIAYERINDGYVPLTVIIDKKRIMRAYNSSQSIEKTVWKNDTQRMVLKTASHCLYNEAKPYIEIPTSIKRDWEETNDQMEFDSINAESQEQHQIIEQNVCDGEMVDFDDEETVTYEAEIIKE